MSTREQNPQAQAAELRAAAVDRVQGAIAAGGYVGHPRLGSRGR